MPSPEYEACCEVLDIHPGASETEIKAAYRDLVKVWHPDRFPNDPRLREKAQGELKRVNEAFEFLRAAGFGVASTQQRSERPSEPDSAPSASTSPRSYSSPSSPSPPSAAAPARTTRAPRWKLILVAVVAVTAFALLYPYLTPDGGNEPRETDAVESAPIIVTPGSMSNTYQKAPIEEPVSAGRTHLRTDPAGNLVMSADPSAKSGTSSNRFTRGSHKDDLLRIQGTPSNITSDAASGQEIWFYGASTVTISSATGQVEEWSDRGNLKVRPEPGG